MSDVYFKPRNKEAKMKKLKKIAFLGVLACVALFAFTGCGLKPLKSPLKLNVNEANVLSWAAVEDAKSYKIQVVTVTEDEESGESEENEENAVTEYSSRKTNYSLSKLPEGDYVIKVKAVADGKTYTDSE